MIFSHEKYPLRKEREIFINDGKINQIICNEERVRFYFLDGLCYVKEGKVISETGGYIEFLKCSSDDFFCSLIRRSRIGEKMFFVGRRVSLLDLSVFLNTHRIEIYKELCDESGFLWRGAVLPYKRRLSDRVEIEFEGNVAVNYCVDNV